MSRHSNMSTKYSLSLLAELLESRQISLEQQEIEAIRKCRNYLEGQLLDHGRAYYGINTGFGALCDIRIPDHEIQDLQHNLIVSHACGSGDIVHEDIARITLLLKIISLSGGYSGVRVELIQFLIDLYNADVLPVLYELGSLGASGDLAPLAHLGLVVIGEGEVIFQGEQRSTKEVFHSLGLRPMQLAAKEGLALLNGTQFSTALAVHACLKFERLLHFSHSAATLSIEAFNCSPAPFDPLIHEIRNQNGQIHSAKLIRQYLRGSDIGLRNRYAVQDPYSFRCIPQVYGASIDAYTYVGQVVTREINGVTDNPNIFRKEDKILSGGNFHAQPIAYASDFLAIAAAEIGNMSERRTYKLVSGQRDLPPFLTRHAGTHSGLMIPQYTAASIVSQNKQLSTPASVDSITSSIGQEDHVSMAANAGTKLTRIIENVTSVLCIEWMTAAQAMEFRHAYRINSQLERLLGEYRRNYVPALDGDRILHTDMENTKRFFEDNF